MGGNALTQVLIGEQRYDLVLRYLADYRDTREAIEKIRLLAPTGERVSLAQLTKVSVMDGGSEIYREANSRYVAVKFSVRSRDLGSTVEEAMKKVDAAVKLPPGYTIDWSGEYESAKRALIRNIGVIPAVRVSSGDDAHFAAETVTHGGIPIVEITLTVPGAVELIAHLCRSQGKIAVGAGTVLDEETARKCVDAGACFLTSPNFNAAVVGFAVRRNTPVLPGALTPTEVVAAWSGGADFVKVFPCGRWVATATLGRCTRRCPKSL